jgi:S1-C subfamily serine protease
MAQTRFMATMKVGFAVGGEVETPVALGSRVVLDRKGDIVTNNHVVGYYKHLQVTDSTVKRYRDSVSLRQF